MTSRRLFAATAALALLTACGGGGADGDKESAAAPEASRPQSTAPALGSSVHPTATPRSAGASRAPGTSSSSSAAAPSQPGRATTAARPASSRPAAASSQWTAAGSYSYDAHYTYKVGAGTPQSSSGTATLTVDAPAGGQQHSALDSDAGRTEQDVVPSSSGISLARLVLTNPSLSKEFRIDPPGLLVPSPTTVGRTWTWSAKSTDGRTTATVDARVDRFENVTVEGRALRTAVIVATLTLSGDVAYKGTQETWYDGTSHLPVKDHTKGSGSVNGVPFTSDVSTLIRSTRPS